ncbi:MULTISPECIES: EAL domain-containing protein [Gordonibacter]|uniref:EAL domain-containing protein n=1 Tax=Gordonibacter faecis TaxID=3047475 RepID=A0ABT7DRS4_9ACTN|nr:MULTISPECIES: EAL domain-containing protein [unclassified Gordonibacter]MDJ1651288.1 EAL domain-containing protein [Gordonibacter sp. KGMB12511]HIW76306.1 EAL domain-containing protein [Candidatus Gordonibacter avicola]
MGNDKSDNVSAQHHTYVIDRTYRVVYMDKAAHRVFPAGQVGLRCYESFRGASEPCGDCPWQREGNDSSTQTVIFSANRNTWFEITCLEVDWFNEGPCVLFSGRPVEDGSRSLFSTLSQPSSYDELFELNLTGDAYKVLYTEPDKYVMPALEGQLSVMFEDVLEHMIHPEDRGRFQEFWEFGTLLARIERSGGILRGEFRKRLMRGGWGWASQTLVPVKRGEAGETVVMCFIADIDAEVKARKGEFESTQILQLKEHDQLTGLYNAVTFYERAEALVKQHPEDRFEVVYLDIEHFKLYNEWHGRDAGDIMLRAIAERFAFGAECCGGVAGYLGGDDFAIVLPAGTVTEAAVEHDSRRPPFDSEDTIGFQPAVGVCTIEPGDSVGTACDHAMIAMASVKGIYGKRIAWYENSMTEELESETKTLLEVQRALANREFVLYWQPQCSTRTGRIVGLEALVRWQHPRRGLVMPGSFVPVLERNGFIASLDLYVWDEACRQLRAWIDRGEQPVPVSVNISRADLYAIDVVSTFEELLQRYGLDHHLLELEITESAYAEDERMTTTVERLKEHGFTILMDDFGSGYSSLNMLKDVNVDILKIDMGFLNRANESKRSESILEAVVSMARLMDLRIIAEGTETKEQVDFLQSIGCDYAQGYYFYRPMSTETLEALLTQEGVVDLRGVLSPTMELIDMKTLLRDDVTSRAIIDSLVGGVAVYAVYPDRFELLQVNNAYYRVTGCNAVDLCERQKLISRQVHPDDLPIVIDMFNQAERHPVTGAEGTFRRYRLSGELMWMHMKAFFLRHEQDRSLFFCSLSDVTEQGHHRDEDAHGSMDGQ